MTASRRIRLLRSWASLVLTIAVASLLWPAGLGGDVSYVMVSGTSMEPGLHTGDLVLVRPSPSYEVGDEIAYRVPDGEVGEGSIVIHRVVGGDADGYEVQGDNRDHADIWTPSTDDVVGKRYVLVAGAARVMVRLRNPAALGVLAGVLTLVAMLVPSRRDRREAAAVA